MSDTAAASLTCPKCSSQLVRQAHESTFVDACPRRCGVFITADALNVAMHDRTDDRPESEEQTALAGAGPLKLVQMEAAEHTITCPACGAPMQKRNYAYESGVVLDACDAHGFWLDTGELERIEAWFEGNERASAGDAATWGPRLQRIREDAGVRADHDEADMHWGPIRAILRMIPGSFT